MSDQEAIPIVAIGYCLLVSIQIAPHDELQEGLSDGIAGHLQSGRARAGNFEARMTRRSVRIEVWGEGPGIPERVRHGLQAGTYRSPTGLGKGLAGCKTLMDTFRVMSMPGRTHAVMAKNL